MLTSMIFNKYKFITCSNYNNFKGNSCVFLLFFLFFLFFWQYSLIDNLLYQGIKTSHLTVSFSNCAVSISHVIVLLSHSVVSLFIFSHLMVLLSYWIIPTLHFTVHYINYNVYLLPYMQILFIINIPLMIHIKWNLVTR